MIGKYIIINISDVNHNYYLIPTYNNQQEYNIKY